MEENGDKESVKEEEEEMSEEDEDRKPAAMEDNEHNNYDLGDVRISLYQKKLATIG